MCGTDHFLVQKVQIFFKFISRIPRVAVVTKSGACSIVHCVIGFKMHDFKSLLTLTYDLHQCHTRTFATSVNRWWLHKNNQNARIIAWPFPFLTAKPILPAGLKNANTAGFISAQASHWYELRFHLFIYLFLQTLLTIPRKQGLELMAPSLVGAIRGTISDVISHFGCFFPPNHRQRSAMIRFFWRLHLLSLKVLFKKKMCWLWFSNASRTRDWFCAWLLTESVKCKRQIHIFRYFSLEC